MKLTINELAVGGPLQKFVEAALFGFFFLQCRDVLRRWILKRPGPFPPWLRRIAGPQHFKTGKALECVTATRAKQFKIVFMLL